jgi:hypothetical protein
MANMYVPHKETKMGFALQSGLGVPAAAPTLMFPLDEGADGPDVDKKYRFFQYSDGTYSLRHHQQEGELVTGTVNIPILPGHLSYTNESPTGTLGDWLWARSGAADYYQGYYATLWRDLGNGLVEIFSDVKVKSGGGECKEGNPARLKIEFTGLTAPVTDTVANWAALAVDAAFMRQPYHYSGLNVALAYGDGTYGVPGTPAVADSYTSNHSLDFDNMLADPKAMTTARANLYPIALPNTAFTEWKGSFDRLFVNTDLYDAFLAGAECALELTFTHAVGAAAAMLFPRIVISDYKAKIPSSGIVVENGVGWQALGLLE